MTEIIEIIEKTPLVEEYNDLMNAVHWGKRDEKIVEEALKNSIYCICAYEDDKLVGFGRIIGDRTIFLYLQDVMVNPSYQGQGIGAKIIKKLLEEIEKLKKVNPDIRVYLCASKDKESFYEKFGFVKRPNDELGAGMILKNK